MDIRKSFLDYFAKKEHTINDSAPLVPDDATLLFTNAGMVAFKPIFTGEVPAPKPPRAVSSQLCLRAGGKHNDLDNVGYTARHHTLFEMLGNFSFGDYFKEDAIKFGWEFITEIIGLDKSKLWISIHDSDDEAYDIWKKYVDEDKIVRMGDKDNFWQMGDTGPCGPCSEIHYDQGEENFNSKEDYFGGDGDRFLEIWNLVFMQYNRGKNGNLNPLPKPSIDTGMGLERIVAIKEGVFSNYDSSIFMPLINEIVKIVDKKYEYNSGASYRVIADHIRAVTFLVAQGVTFDKEGRGYVLRRILRRAVRHGYKLGLREPFMYKLASKVIEMNSEHYVYLKEKENIIYEQIKLEEERFFSTIENGMKLFNEALKSTEDTFSGEIAFKLYDTHGFPLDLTEDMLRELDISLDCEAFDVAMNRQKAMAKAAWKGSGDNAKDGDFKIALEKFGENRFVGYDSLSSITKIEELFDDDMKIVNKLKSGESGWIMLKDTPFYATSGGQSGDCGIIKNFAKVTNSEKFFGLNLSKIIVEQDINKGLEVEAIVDSNRTEITRHHSATHLLHSALTEILGDLITQAGSLVEANRLRFDFTYPKALTQEQIQEVEAWVNFEILSAKESKTQELTIQEAKKSGAKAQFGEKYGDIVRVVSIGDKSIEFCGGTHINNTSEIGSFYILKESGVSAGVRRIEAVCSKAAYKFVKQIQNQTNKAKELLKAKDLDSGILKLQAQVKKIKEELKSVHKNISTEVEVQKIKDIAVIINEISGGDIQAIVDDNKAKYEKVAILLMQTKDNKVRIATGTKGCDIHAGDWLRNIAVAIGGKGGGRADFASGGGNNPDGIKQAKELAFAYIKEKLDA